ncbi:hypothetical protein LC607_12125 [Nostoc sp. CHAB 5824]|nr:hypothetical protein [Nostoc sp. CHAB 5824]
MTFENEIPLLPTNAYTGGKIRERSLHDIMENSVLDICGMFILRRDN